MTELRQWALIMALSARCAGVVSSAVPLYSAHRLGVERTASEVRRSRTSRQRTRTSACETSLPVRRR